MTEKQPPKKRTRQLTSVKKANTAAFLQQEEDRISRRAYEMRRAGKSWWEIAEALDIPESRVKKLFDVAISKAADLVSQEEKRKLLIMEVERLDALQNAQWDMATSWTEIETEDGVRSVPPSVKAGEFVLKVAAQRARLLGLDEAAVANVAASTVIVGGTSTEYLDALRQLRERTFESETVPDQTA
jgi:hypothetical protein